MKTTYIPLALSIIALFVAGSVYFEKSNPSAATYDGNTGVVQQGQSAALIQQLDRLEQRISELEYSLLTGRNKLDTPEPAIMDVPESELAQMQEVFDMFGSFAKPQELKRLKSDPEFANAHFSKLKSTIDDDRLSDNERLGAIQSHVMSSMMMNMNESEAQASLAVALDIALTSTNAEDQVRAWEILTGIGSGNEATKEQLTQPLLDLAVDDENPYLRKLAVQGLHNHLMMSFGAPGTNTERIANTLDYVRNNDSSQDVRRQAEQALSNVEQMRDMLKNRPEMAIESAPSGDQNMPIGDAIMYTDGSSASFELVAPVE